MKQQLPYQKTVLPNGVRLILIPMSGVNSIATSVMVGVGSRYETTEINGISHFLEHMVFKGTQKYPTTDDVNEIERIGGLQNAYTDIDITNYHNKVLSSDWRLALEINKELALKPRLEQKYVDKERDVILEEMKRYEDEPSSKVSEVLHQTMYPDSKLGLLTIGTEKALRAADATTLRSYHDSWYTADRIVVVMAGMIPDNGKKAGNIQEVVEEWFGGLTGRSEGGIEIVKENQMEPRVAVTTKPDAQQAHLEIGLRTFARSSNDRFAWNIFNLLMGVSFTSRLFKEIREKRGLCYHIRSSSSGWADVGNWSIYAGVATDKVKETISAIMTELTRAVQSGVTDEEVAIAKKRLLTMLAFKSEDPEFQNEYYGRQELFGEPILTLSEYENKLSEVTKAEINSLIRKYIRTQTLNASIVWNKPMDQSLASLLHI